MYNLYQQTMTDGKFTAELLWEGYGCLQTAIDAFNNMAWEEESPIENEKCLPFVTDSRGRIVAHAHYDDCGLRINWTIVDGLRIRKFAYRQHGADYVADPC